ncbi:hypothetical protein AB3N00_03880 [Paenibacillus xylanilyticus]
MRIISFVCIFLLVLTGCSKEKTETITPDHSKPNRITLTPIDLSQGEAARFKPFLGMMSGAFKLAYEGSKPYARLDMDIWENGKKVDSAGSIGDLFFSLEGQEKSNEIDLIISIDSVSTEEQKN